MQPRSSHTGAGVGVGAGGFACDCPPIITVLLLSLGGLMLVTVTVVVCEPVVTLLPVLPPVLLEALALLVMLPPPLWCAGGVCGTDGNGFGSVGNAGAGAGALSSRVRSERSAANAGVASKRDPTRRSATVVRIQMSLLGVRKTKCYSVKSVASFPAAVTRSYTQSVHPLVKSW